MGVSIIQHTLKTIKIQKEMVSLQDEVKNRIKVMEKDIKKFVTETLKRYFPLTKFEIFASFDGGCMVSSWNPYVSIFSVNGLTYTDQNYWTDRWNQKDKIEKNHINLEELKIVLEKISEEIGIPCKLSVIHIQVKEDVQRITRSEDLKLLYPDIEILEEGQIWTIGWDIADIFFITKINKKFVLFLSKNVHGFGIDEITNGDNPNQNKKFLLDRFFKFINKDSNNKHLEEKYYHIILENWS